jgi:hypothetical protein
MINLTEKSHFFRYNIISEYLLTLFGFIDIQLENTKLNFSIEKYLKENKKKDNQYSVYFPIVKISSFNESGKKNTVQLEKLKWNLSFQKAILNICDKNFAEITNAKIR